MNQHMKLLVLLTLAVSWQVDQVFIPPAVCRDTYQQLEPRWLEQPASTLWDVESIQRFLAQHGIQAIIGTSRSQIPSNAVHMIRKNPQSLYFLTKQAKSLVDRHLERWKKHKGGSSKRPQNKTPKGRGHHRKERGERGGRGLLGRDQGRNQPSIWLHAESLFWALKIKHLPLYTEVARAVRFNHDLAGLADALADRMRDSSPSGKFNGLHLRIEQDWLVAKRMTEERQSRNLAQCATLVHLLKMNTSDPLYIAAAIFHNESGEIDPRLCNFCADWFSRELPRVEIKSHHQFLKGVLPWGSLPAVLHSEQAALLDFLVLMKADRVVGFVESSFSFNLGEYRALAGRRRNTMAFVNATAQYWTIHKMDLTTRMVV